MAKNDKTNVMRVLEQHKIPYEGHNYLDSGAVGGTEVAAALNEDPEVVFKTLVTVGNDREHYVFVIPIEKELDLKKCAKSVGVKSVEMIHVKDLFQLTGYVRGGCTSIGMKKAFVTRVDASAEGLERMYVSGGKIGCQICLAPLDLLKADGGEFADLCM